ncbi:hypothetical protein [Acinetobacter rudis]|uniref:DUF4440 domain-containing protein n=1 Tax=Acinetobacter rudis CIP 110305 TaxID=421052 RepID=S3N552_9GAMM|nr:hypothetical protein [Acinetobacter rudis]EPF73598.1 hypothetical protein F945_02035 [Acinetobacter rudis CIP 110305]
MQFIDRIIALELSLHTYSAQRNDSVWLDKVLHQDFHEITKSGDLVSRSEVIAALLSEDDVVEYHGYDYQLMNVTQSSVILIYKTQMAKNPIPTLRSSHWILNALGEWQLIFHQGTISRITES